jgi:hypothetical protein
VNHLNKYAIINPSQYSFQKNLSTDSAIYPLLNEVLTALNNNSEVKGIFCDIEKTFDCVNHDILLHKLEIYVVTSTTRELFSQFLNNRHQLVNLKVNLSGQTLTANWSKIKHGVPQGSVFGQLLFLLYINDFPTVSNELSTPIRFTDNTSLVVTDSNSISIAAKLSSTLRTVYKWFKSNLLSINLSKTYRMQFRTKNSV